MISQFAAGQEVHVNTTTALEQEAPRIVVLDNGNYLVAWKDSNGAPGNTRTIRAQLYSADGTPIGSEFRLDSTNTAPNSSFDLAALPGGGFVAVWSGEDGQPIDDDQIRAQFYAANGTKVGAEFTVNSTTTNYQYDPSVAVLSNGNVLITWTNASGYNRIGPDSIGTSVMGQILTPAGEGVGGEFLVNSIPDGQQAGAKVTALTGGGFVAVWNDGSGKYGDPDNAVLGQVFTDFGTKVGSAFRVNTVTANTQHAPSVAALPNGGFVVSWTDNDGIFTGGAAHIKARLFDAGGVAAGGEIKVNSDPGGRIPVSTITGLAGGGFLISWNYWEEPVDGQLFDDSGHKVGGQFEIAPATNRPWETQVAALADGGFAVTYSAIVDPPGTWDADRGIALRRFTVARDGVSSLGTPAGEPIAGGDLDDYLDGQGGDDVLSGGGGADILYGRSGNDILDGGAGDDRLLGGLGDDLYLDVDSGDTIVEQGGTDEVRTGIAAYTLAAGVENLTGTGAGQLLIGNGLANRIVGGAGADRLEGRAGDDSLDGGAGADELHGGSGNDTYLVDDPGDLVVEAGASGTDIVRTGLAAYALTVDVENLTGTSGSGQVLTGNALANRILAGAGNDRLEGGDGADTLDGGAGSDELIGGSGNDVLYYKGDPAAADLDRIEGGDGVDTLLVSFPTPAEHSGLVYSLTENPLGGYDGWIANGAGDRVEFTSIERFIISGTDAADLILGGTLNDVLTGLGGDDTLDGGAGADALDGGTGADRMTGGGGNDAYHVDDVGDVVVEEENGGIDGITTTLASYTLGLHIERLYGDSAAGQVLTGNTVANIITGGAGNDTIDGREGADQMAGYGGDDIYFVDNAGDTITDQSGTDEIRSRLATTDLASLWFIENLTGLLDTGQSLLGNDSVNRIAGGGGNDVLAGRWGDDQLLGGAGDDSLDGGVGNDTMTGGTGNDLYLVDSHDDRVVELAGEGTDEIRVGLTGYTLPAEVENLTGVASVGQTLNGNGLGNVLRGNTAADWLDGREGDDRLFGNGGNDTLVGSGGDDELDGGLGADTMRGGTGSDIYWVDNSSDVVTELAGQGVDEVRTTLATYTLGLNVENLTGIAASGQTLVGNSVANAITGGTGNDTLDGGGGADSMVGGLGDDIYIVEDSGDIVTEASGEGTDEVRTALADYTIPDHVEKLTGTAAAGTAQTLRGNSGNNIVAGGASNDLFRLEQGGSDSASGGLGDDAFIFGAALDALDVVDGGEGGRDQLGIQGDYSGFTFGASNLGGIETLAILSGSDTRFGAPGTARHSYELTTLDSNVAAGKQLVVNMNGLLLGENVRFDGSAETDGNFFFYGGGGTDHLIGGAKADSFFFGDGLFSATDRVVGGADRDQLGLRGTHTMIFGADTMSGIETLALVSGSDTRFGSLRPDSRFDITTHDSNVAAGEQLSVNANGLLAGETLVFDGSAETDGFFRILSGRGDDILTGGAGNDIFYGNGGKDRLTGGGGNDVFLYRSVDDSRPGTAADEILDFRSGDRIDLSAIDADSTLAGNQAFTFIDGAEFSNQAGELRVTVNGSLWTVQADTDGDGEADFELTVTAADGHLPVAQDFSF